jgi:hypothetical protein
MSREATLAAEAKRTAVFGNVVVRVDDGVACKRLGDAVAVGEYARRKCCP